jgi:hypothetical protein
MVCMAMDMDATAWRFLVGRCLLSCILISGCDRLDVFVRTLPAVVHFGLVDATVWMCLFGRFLLAYVLD